MALHAHPKKGKSDVILDFFDSVLAFLKKNKFVVPVFAVVVVLLVVFLVFGQEHNQNLAADGDEVSVTIAEGSTASDFADDLFDAGLIDSRSSFSAELKAKGADSKLKPGSYLLHGGMSTSDLIDALVAGPGTATAVVVPEGSTMKAISQIVEKAYGGSISASEFLDDCSNPSRFEADYPFVKGASSLEGFLFPKTYDLLTGSSATADAVVRQMLDQYRDEVSVLDYSYPKSKGLSEYQTLILASIVEKEGTADTYAKVAAVFYNRLTTKGAPTYGFLGSDATTAYELGGDVSGYDWSTKSPYNTRKTKGLCPTPICSPGIETLKAVCDPDKNMVDYYFFSFWPNDSGGVDYYFDKTYEDHQKTIAAHS